MKRLFKTRILILCFTLVATAFLFTGCQTTDDGLSVTFDTCTNLETNKIKETKVEKGSTIAQPNIYTVDEKYSHYMIEGWYVDPEYTTKWDFTTDVVNESIVLYAKWEKQFFIRYFVSNQVEPRYGYYVMEGDKAERQDQLVLGHKVLGYYQDAGYSIPYDFSQPITADTDIYMRMSDSIHWDAKMIAEHFVIEKASGDTSEVGTITYEEDEDGEGYVRVDFGYAERSDARIAGFGPLDMTKSQVVTITYKNLGNSPGFRFFWTVEYPDQTVSGQIKDTRTWDYGEAEIKRNMSEDDEWETLTIDMGELSVINGASQWAGGEILQMFRMDSLYAVWMDEKPVDDIMLIKDISFAPAEEYPSGDTVEIEADNVFDMMDAAKEQKSIKNGFVFPKDRENSIPKQGTVQYNMEDCVTYLFPYGTKDGLVTYDFSDMNIDMNENRMIYIRYMNQGFSPYMTVRYTNKEGVRAEIMLEMKVNMKAYGTLIVNMMDEDDWDGNLDTIDLIYHKKDANNVLSIQQIYVKEFEPALLPGLNFNDDECLGFETCDEYKVTYDPKNGGSYFEMFEDNVVLQKNVSVDTSAYDSLSFEYNMPINGVEKIKLSYMIGGVWYTETMKDLKKTSGFETVSFKLQKKGIVTAMKIELIERGKISFRSLQFKVSEEYALDLSDGKYINDHFNSMWLVNYGIDYDPVKTCAVLSGKASAESRVMFYIGASGYRENILLDSVNKKVYMCYNNPGKAREVALSVYYASSDNLKGSGMAGDDPNVSETKGVHATAKLKGKMKAGQWAVAVFDFSDLGLFSADRNATMISLTPGGELYVRSFSFN